CVAARCCFAHVLRVTAILFLSSRVASSPTCTLFPYTTLFRSVLLLGDYRAALEQLRRQEFDDLDEDKNTDLVAPAITSPDYRVRSEEHTSELQSRFDLVCRLLLDNKNREAHQSRHARTISSTG